MVKKDKISLPLKTPYFFIKIWCHYVRQHMRPDSERKILSANEHIY